MEIKYDHSYKGYRCGNLFVDTLYKTFSCDGIAAVAWKLRMDRFVGSLA